MEYAFNWEFRIFDRNFPRTFIANDLNVRRRFPFVVCLWSWSTRERTGVTIFHQIFLRHNSATQIVKYNPFRKYINRMQSQRRRETWDNSIFIARNPGNFSFIRKNHLNAQCPGILFIEHSHYSGTTDLFYIILYTGC